MVIVHGVVPSRPIVPECDRPRCPLIAVGVFRPHHVLIQHAEKRRTLAVIPLFDPHRECRIDVKRLPTADRVANNQGVNGVLYRRIGVAESFGESGPIFGNKPRCRDRNAGLMGSFGRRMAGTDGYDEAADFFEYRWNAGEEVWECRLPDTVLEALTLENLVH